MERSTTITPTRTQTKTINTTITTPTETEEGDTQKEYEAFMSGRAQKRAAEYGDEFGNDEDLLASQDSFFDELSPSSSENNIDVAGDVGKGDVQATLQAALQATLARASGEGRDSTSELLASGSSPPPTKRQRIPRTMPVQIVDADWGTSQSRLRHQLQDESPLFPEGLSSESSDTVEEVESDTVEEVEEPPDSS